MFYKFFWWISGANIEVLSEYKEDHNKFFHIGLTIFITVVAAIFTSSFAFNVAINGFNNGFTFYAILIGLAWGVIIFNIDRFIVISMKKKGSFLLNSTPYEKWNEFKQELIPALPRIFLAILIAKIILEPFELFIYKQQIIDLAPEIQYSEKKVYNDSIENKMKDIKEMHDIKMNLIILNVKSSKYEISSLTKEIKSKTLNSSNDSMLKSHFYDLEVLNKSFDKYNQIYLQQLDTGKGPVYRTTLKIINEISDKITRINKNIKKRESEIVKSNSENSSIVDALKDKRKQYIENNKGYIQEKANEEKTFLEEYNIEKNKMRKYEIGGKINLITALKTKDELFSRDNKYNRIHMLLMILIFSIELLPIILKILSFRSAYDANLQAYWETIAIEHDKELSLKRFKANLEIRKFKMEHNLEYKKLIKNRKKA